MNWQKAKPNGDGIFRIFGYSPDESPPRVWIGEVFNEKGKVKTSPILSETTIINLRSAGRRRTAEAFAAKLNFG